MSGWKALHSLICLNDLMATCVEIVGDKLPDNAGEDWVRPLSPLSREAATKE